MSAKIECITLEINITNQKPLAIIVNRIIACSIYRRNPSRDMNELTKVVVTSGPYQMIANATFIAHRGRIQIIMSPETVGRLLRKSVPEYL